VTICYKPFSSDTGTLRTDGRTDRQTDRFAIFRDKSHGKERIDFKKFFELADTTSWLRGHSLKLYKPRCHTTLRQNFFSIRVINEWNKLPQSVIEAPSVNAFKNRLDKYWSDMGDYS